MQGLLSILRSLESMLSPTRGCFDMHIFNEEDSIEYNSELCFCLEFLHSSI